MEAAGSLGFSENVVHKASGVFSNFSSPRPNLEAPIVCPVRINKEMVIMGR